MFIPVLKGTTVSAPGIIYPYDPSLTLNTIESLVLLEVLNLTLVLVIEDIVSLSRVILIYYRYYI